MKLHITVLASSLALAMPALAKDIPCPGGVDSEKRDARLGERRL